jgi:hypothetical protein
MAFDISVPTPFILMLRLRSGAQQWIASEEYRLKPSVPVFEFSDSLLLLVLSQYIPVQMS